MFYVYEWYIKNTNEIIYVGKGSKKRYLSKQHNKIFTEFIKRYDCESRIIKEFENEQEAYLYEYDRIIELKNNNQAVCNIIKGGNGGGASMNTAMKRWTDEERKKYSINNVMKSKIQRERMEKNNPMKNKEYAMKNGIKHRKPFFIGDTEYQTLKKASLKYGVSENGIRYWLMKGKNPVGENCYYKQDNQQPSQVNVDKSNLKGSTTNR